MYRSQTMGMTKGSLWLPYQSWNKPQWKTQSPSQFKILFSTGGVFVVVVFVLSKFYPQCEAQPTAQMIKSRMLYRLTSQAPLFVTVKTTVI